VPESSWKSSCISLHQGGAVNNKESVKNKWRGGVVGEVLMDSYRQFCHPGCEFSVETTVPVVKPCPGRGPKREDMDALTSWPENIHICRQSGQNAKILVSK
jgi:hypothetical protein